MPAPLRPALLALSFVLALAGACDSGDDDDDGDDGACASHPGSSEVIPESQIDTPYPTPAGGTLVDGSWDLVRFEVYSPATADEHTRAERLIIAGDSLVSIRSKDGGPEEIIAATVTVDGTKLDLSVTCPMAGSISVPFTATDTELWLFDPQESDVKIYVKQ